MAPGSVTLQQLRDALQQQNVAVCKRALAIIFNEVRTEAVPLVQEFVGRVTDQTLQDLGLKVLEKLRSFQEDSVEIPTERLLPLLQHQNPEGRLLALRGLANHVSPDLGTHVLNAFPDTTDEEILLLICGILKRNPSPNAIVFLQKATKNPAEKVRLGAIEALLNVIYGCLLPSILTGFLDQSPQLKMKAYQAVSGFNRTSIMATLSFMLNSSDVTASRLAAQILPNFLGPDLVPVLERHLEHTDAETMEHCKKALVLLAQKGHFEAVKLLERVGRPSQKTSAGQATVGDFSSLLRNFPYYLSEPVQHISPLSEPLQCIQALHDSFIRLNTLVNTMLLVCYFQLGQRTPALDRLTFQLLREGIEQADFARLVTSLGSTFPRPSDENDLFPVVLASQVKRDFRNHLIESFKGFRQKTERVLKQIFDPQTAVGPIQADFTNILQGLSSMASNRILTKVAVGASVKVFDFMKSKPESMNLELLYNFELPMTQPILVSPDLSRSFSLAPFFHFHPVKQTFAKKTTDEQELSGFLAKYSALNHYLEFLKEQS